MATREQKVQIFSLGLPKPGTPKAGRRYRVKWAVDGNHKTRSFKTREQADRYRSTLQQSVRDGLRFDIATGEPVHWEQSAYTWWSWSSDWLAVKWPSLAGHSRRSLAEGMVMIAPHLVRRRAPASPSDLMAWLWKVGYVPTVEKEPCPELAWLERWSIPLVDITPGLLESALTAATTRQDGQRTSPDVSRRRYASVNGAFRAAVRREVIDRNPVDRVEWSVPRKSAAINISVLPSVGEVLAIVEEMSSDEAYGHYAAFFCVLALAGLRPSEAARLRVDDLTLPGDGWGEARLRGALTSPGELYTSDGSTVEKKALKQRAEQVVRPVPLPPLLVTELKRHIARHSRGPTDRLFVNRLGNELTKDNWGKPWREHRAKRWPTGHRFAKTRPYDLRHVAATMMLRAGVPAAEVALRLGHSIDMLMQIYAGVFEDERQRANGLIDAELSPNVSIEPR